MSVTHLIDAWSEAARDLGVRVESTESGVLVHDFGRPAGTLCIARDASAEQKVAAHQAADDEGYFLSELWPSYNEYDRDLFAATLNDWGWFGEGASPDWYTGEPWG
jgi:hypothetical protein